MFFFVEQAHGELDIGITNSLWCMCMRLSILLDLSGPELLYLWMDFKLIWSNCSPQYKVDVSFEGLINPLPEKPTLGYSNFAANKDMTLKIWTNGDTVTWFE